MGERIRYFENKLPDWRNDCPQILNCETKQLKDTVLIDVDSIFQRLLKILEAKVDFRNKSDGSVYTGNSGIAFLYLLLFEKTGNTNFLKEGIAFTNGCHVSRRDVTFLCGKTGLLSVKAVLNHRLGEVENSSDHIKTVLEFLPRVLSLENDMPDELLYGRVGYLYSLLFLEKNIPGCIPSSTFKQVGLQIIDSGLNSGVPPLMWTWHGKRYIGGAHGVSGIIYILLQIKDQLDTTHLNLIRQTLDYLLSIRFSSGNFPSSIGSSDDKLVHWCHGSPGVVQLLLTAYHIWDDGKYLAAAEQCGDVVWNRGLLKKGYGLCHGVAGNAYTFLALYQATGTEKHLHRAVQFAYWCGTYNDKQERSPDRQYSLFEGLAGTVYFLKDIQSPLQALFPAYSLTPLSLT